MFSDPKTAQISDLLELAQNHMGNHKFDDAKELLEKAGLRAAKDHGEGSLEFANCLYNYADLYAAQGNLKSAASMYESAIKISEILETPNPEMAKWRNSLSQIYKEQARYDDAMDVQKDIFDDQRDEPPAMETHIDKLNNLASLFESKGNIASAEPLYIDAIEAATKHYGTNHPRYALILNNYANLLEGKGETERATNMLRDVTQILADSLGKDHPQYAMTMGHLGGNLTDQGDYEGALRAHNEALGILTDKLGASHPDTIKAANNRAFTLHKSGRNLEALDIYLESLDQLEDILGDAHPDYAICMTNIARVCQALNKPREAEIFFKRALTNSQSHLGIDHPIAIKIDGYLRAFEQGH